MPTPRATEAGCRDCAQIYLGRGARHARVDEWVPSRIKRGQGMPDARCTRGRLCSKKSTGVSNQGYTATTGIPCTMVLTVSFVLFPLTGLFCHRHLADKSARLSASVGALEPHDFAVRHSIIRP